METKEMIGAVIVAILAASGFWRLIESLLTYASKKRLARAQTKNILVDANTQVTENWIAWSTKMETRVNELESKNAELLSIISKQRNKTTELEKQVVELKSKNSELKGITTKQRGRITELEKQVEKLEKINADLNKRK